VWFVVRHNHAHIMTTYDEQRAVDAYNAINENVPA
jgi:hypothetical protein